MPDLCVRNKQTKASKDKTEPDNGRKSNKIMPDYVKTFFSGTLVPAHINSQITADAVLDISEKSFGRLSAVSSFAYSCERTQIRPTYLNYLSQQVLRKI